MKEIEIVSSMDVADPMVLANKLNEIISAVNKLGKIVDPECIKDLEEPR